MHARIEICIEFRDGPGDLRSHLDRNHRVDGSGGLHDVMDITSFHLRGKVLRLSIPVQPQGDEHSRHSHHHCYDEPLAFCHYVWSRKLATLYSYRSASIGSSRDALRAG